ncbi:hypothetical protein ACQ9BO_19525 [Flavobacterium sp. P21]|uniref:hypothetical protein n=1 Tax=Flavobacterium sp. P21 TaxID=3423948 RepID=UPI003D679369
METAQNVIDLLSQKYKSRISVLTNTLENKFCSILDTKNGTIFSVSCESLFVFKDSKNNFWSTTPKSFIYNNQKHYPTEGQEYTSKNGAKYTFTNKEAVLKRAVAYFEKFIDPCYGIKIANEKFIIYESLDKTKFLALNLQKFKARMFSKVDTYLSFN